jgi:hypothetical protein
MLRCHEDGGICDKIHNNKCCIECENLRECTEIVVMCHKLLVCPSKDKIKQGCIFATEDKSEV